MAFDWGSLIGGIASVWAGKEASDASKKAGQQQAQGAQAATDLYRYIYEDQRGLNMPAYNDGNAARAQYMRMLGLTPSASNAPAGQAQAQAPIQWFGDNNRVPTANQQLYSTDQAYRRAWDEVAASHQKTFGKGYTNDSSRDAIQQQVSQLYSQYAPKPQHSEAPIPVKPGGLTDIYGEFRSTPGYQFGLQEGSRAIESSAAARGGLNSGATLKALQKFGTDYADQQGFTPYMNRLAGLFGGAQTAVSNIGSAGNNYAAGAGNAQQSAANARAQSTYNSASAWQQGLEGAWRYGNQMGQNQGWWG